jgi:hypothetical protein
LCGKEMWDRIGVRRREGEKGRKNERERKKKEKRKKKKICGHKGTRKLPFHR